jgi:hypothetical protein
MTFRGFLYRIGLVPLRELDELRGLNAVLFGRARALEAENANLKRAAAERLRSEVRIVGGAECDCPQCTDMRVLRGDPPPLREWRAPFVTSGYRPDGIGSGPTVGIGRSTPGSERAPTVACTPADNPDREPV